MKRVAGPLLALLLLVTLTGCGPKRTVHCDHCGKAVQVAADSNIDEDWILFCKDCEKDLFADDPVVKPAE